ERLKNLLDRTSHGVYVLAAPRDATTPGGWSTGKWGMLLTRLAAVHHFVVVDTPVGLTEVTAAALDISGLAMLVTTPEIAALRRTHACLRLLHGLGFPTSRLQLVLNRMDSRAPVSSQEAVEPLGHPVTWRIANDYA